MAVALTLDPNDPASGVNNLLTAEQILQRKRVADALAAQAGKQRQLTHPLQVAGQALDGLTAGLEMKFARDAESARAGFDRTLNADMAPGGSNPITSNSAVMPSTGASPASASGGSTGAAGAAADPVATDLQPHQRAFLNAVAGPESAGRYNIRYTPTGGVAFAGFDKHPRIFEPGPEGPSSAAGRYQFTATTWDAMGGGNFSPENQDRRAWQLGVEDYRKNTGRDLDADLRAGGFTPQIAKSLQDTWRGFRDNPGKAIRAYSDSMARYSAAPAGPVRVASAAPVTMTDASPAPVQVASLPPTSAPVAPATAQITGALPSMAAANMGLLPAPPSHWQAGPGTAEASAPAPGPMPPITPAATPFPGRQSVVVAGRDTSVPGSTSAPASGQVVAARSAPAASPPLPPARATSMTPIDRVTQALAAQPQQPMGLPEQIADQRAVLQIARTGVSPSAAVSPAVETVSRALNAQAANQNSPRAAQAPPTVTGSALSNVATVANAASSREQAAWRAIGSPYASDGTKRVATMILQQEAEAQRYSRDRKDKLADEQRGWNRDDAIRGEKYTRDDRTLPLDMRLKGAQADEAERRLRGYRPLINPEERAAAGVPADYKGAAQVGPDGQLSFPGKAATEVNIGGGSDKQIFDAMEEGSKGARAAATGLTGLREARAAIQGGAFTGIGADFRLGLQKVGAALGVADSTKIVNTETFRSAIAPQIAAVMKATVGSQNISNSDREFAEKAAGGSITLDEKSINRLLDIMERASIDVLKSHRDRLDRVYPEGKNFDRERAIFGVPFAEPKRAAPPTTGTGVKWKVIQ